MCSQPRSCSFSPFGRILSAGFLQDPFGSFRAKSCRFLSKDNGARLAPKCSQMFGFSPFCPKLKAVSLGLLVGSVVYRYDSNRFAWLPFFFFAKLWYPIGENLAPEAIRFSCMGEACLYRTPHGRVGWGHCNSFPTENKQANSSHVEPLQ